MDGRMDRQTKTTFLTSRRTAEGSFQFNYNYVDYEDSRVIGGTTSSQGLDYFLFYH